MYKALSLALIVLSEQSKNSRNLCRLNTADELTFVLEFLDSRTINYCHSSPHHFLDTRLIDSLKTRLHHYNKCKYHNFEAKLARIFEHRELSKRDFHRIQARVANRAVDKNKCSFRQDLIISGHVEALINTHTLFGDKNRFLKNYVATLCAGYKIDVEYQTAVFVYRKTNLIKLLEIAHNYTTDPGYFDGRSGEELGKSSHIYKMTWPWLDNKILKAIFKCEMKRSMRKSSETEMDQSSVSRDKISETILSKMNPSKQKKSKTASTTVKGQESSSTHPRRSTDEKTPRSKTCHDCGPHSPLNNKDKNRDIPLNKGQEPKGNSLDDY